MKKEILFFVGALGVASLVVGIVTAIALEGGVRNMGGEKGIGVSEQPQRNIFTNIKNEMIGKEQEEHIPKYIYLSVNKNGTQSCEFGDLEGCRLFTIPVGEKEGKMVPDVGKMAEVLEGVSAVLPTVSPDGTRVAFRAGNTGNGVTALGVFGYDLASRKLFAISEGETHNSQAHWPFWMSDRELIASNTNDCTAGSVGCGKSSLYEDLVRFVFAENGTSLTQSEIFLGGTASSLGIDTSACSFANPVIDPTNPERIAFHSSPIDGTGAVQSGACPFVTGRGGEKLTALAQPVPVILNLEKIKNTPSASALVAGEDYYPVDLEGAGISGCAHGSFSAQGIYTCIEQGSLTRDTLCADAQIPLASCVKSGSSLIQRNKLFSFALNETTGVYESVRSGKAAFNHAHPEDLPDSERYWTPGDPCQLYATKYAQSCGEDTFIANVQCIVPTPAEKSGYITAFSRMMLIDGENPEKPLYTDITGLLEDTYPEIWSAGTASGFSATCK